MKNVAWEGREALKLFCRGRSNRWKEKRAFSDILDGSRNRPLVDFFLGFFFGQDYWIWIKIPVMIAPKPISVSAHKLNFAFFLSDNYFIHYIMTRVI